MCQKKVARLSVAASTSAKPPGRVSVHLATPCGEVVVAVTELSFAAGGLGFRLFPSALWLAAFVAARPALLHGRHTVLELGAGLGLVGLAAASCGASRVCLADFHHGLLLNLLDAVRLNELQQRVDVACHDWVADAEGVARSSPADTAASPEYVRVVASQAQQPCPVDHLAADAKFSLIVGTEVLYEEVGARCLPAVLRRRLAPGGRCLLLGAVRDTSHAVGFVRRCSELGMDIHVRCVTALPLPSASVADAASSSWVFDADRPVVGGEWMSSGEAVRALEAGGAGGAPMAAAWVEARAPAAWPAQAGDAACCARAKRGLACPCAARNAAH